ncbi:hypothetical protein JTB14_027804 [Gonioctena quinquepunctata]|nr:hypothetical protein JTB14_027804 [Gonioctena quinquepunctata]
MKLLHRRQFWIRNLFQHRYWKYDLDCSSHRNLRGLYSKVSFNLHFLFRFRTVLDDEFLSISNQGVMIKATRILEEFPCFLKMNYNQVCSSFKQRKNSTEKEFHGLQGLLITTENEVSIMKIFIHSKNTGLFIQICL